jgi:regulator of sigma E protease
MSILIAILVLGVLVFVHELGHFLVAKFFRVGVLEFALGFGRVLASWQWGETTYRLRAIPLGGFVRMAGDDPRAVASGEISSDSVSGASAIEGTQGELTPLQEQMVKDESRWFLKQPYLPRCAIVLAGPLFNFICAWFIASAVFAVQGLPTPKVGTTVGTVEKDMAGDKAGIREFDKIVSVNGVEIKGFDELVQIVRSSDGKALEFVVDRPLEKPEALDGAVGFTGPSERLKFSVTPQSGATEFDILEGRDPEKPTYRIGVGPLVEDVTYHPVSAWKAMKAGGLVIWDFSDRTLRMLKALVTGRIAATKTIGGPIEIIKQTAVSAESGLSGILAIMIFLNVTLGIMNLLPIPVLDGGHLMLFTIELLRGRPLSIKVQEAVMQVGMTVILFLMVFALGNDLVRNVPQWISW